MMRSSWLAAVLVSSLAGCESAVENVGGGGAGGGSAEGGGGNSASCDPTTSLTITVDGANGPADTHLVLTGTLMELAPGSWQLDTCPPTADCGVETLHTFSVEIPGAELHLPTGALVQLTFDDTLDQTKRALVIENLPTWEGTDNPIATDTDQWLHAQELGEGELPFPKKLGCPKTNDDDFDVYDLIADGVTIHPGETKTATISGRPYEVTNVDVRVLYDLPWSESFAVIRSLP